MELLAYVLPRGLTNVIYGMFNHWALLTFAAIWVFWCMGYFPGFKKQGGWRKSPKGVLVMANIVLWILVVIKAV